MIWPRDYKKNFNKLNSSDHEISHAPTYKKYQEIQLFAGLDKH